MTRQFPLNEGSLGLKPLRSFFTHAKQEADVEQGYVSIFKTAFHKNGNRLQFNHPRGIGCDGVMRHNTYAIHTLCEFKFDKDMQDRRDQIKVLLQTLYYLKRLENQGEELPTVVFVGDINECFMVHSNVLTPYLDEKINWTLAASQAADKNPALVRKMLDNDAILPLVYNVKGLKVERILNELVALSNGETAQVRITEKNVHRLFSHFRDKVLSKPDKHTANELVNMFMGMLINPDDYFLHPKKKHTLATKDYGNVKVSTIRYKSFIAHHDHKLTVVEKVILTAVQDRLIADTTRRFQGEFFTPTEWVYEAHDMISEALGDDWKETHVVWDCCCGTKNLTRDYRFKELYCSTLVKGDLDTAEIYNPGSVSFQYDFLNDCDTDLTADIFRESKLPDGLKTALKEGKKLLLLVNPPYGTASSWKEGQDRNKKTMEDTKVKTHMLAASMGKCSRNLYAQFLYRIAQLQKKYKGQIAIGCFTPTLVYSGESYEAFRKMFFDRFGFVNGMTFAANHFSGVSADWGIAFSVLSSESRNRETTFQVKDVDSDTGEIATLGSKLVYDLDGQLPASKWVRQEVKGKPTFDAPQLTSGVKLSTNWVRGRMTANAFGYMKNVANNVDSNATNVALLSTCYGAGNGLSVTPDSFLSVVALFTVRKSITKNWINSKDEYSAPDEANTEYEQWNDDAIVYALFNNSSNQSALRDITYKGKQWDIENQWFWLSNAEMLQLGNRHNADVYEDARQFKGERYVYETLQTTRLSPDAQAVLDMASDLVRLTFDKREDMEDYDDLHLNAWDAGWYQIKRILKEYFPQELAAFVAKYKAFEDRMRDGVYKFGFLKGKFTPDADAD